jgi:hypothetical protein
MAEGAILVAAESAMFDHDGQRVFITAGKTTAREGHPILKGREKLFRPFTVDFELPSKDSSPARPVTAKAKAAGS